MALMMVLTMGAAPGGVSPAPGPQAAWVVGTLSGGGGAQFAVRRVPVEGLPFDKAWRATNTVRPEVTWDFQVNAPTPLAFTKGDNVVLTFWARNGAAGAVAGATAALEMVLEQAGGSYDKVFTFATAVDSTWHRFAVDFTASATYPAHSCQFCVRLGYDPQVAEFGGVEVHNYGPQPIPESAALTKPTYPGREADAAWRAAADARIDEYRKGDLAVRVVDSAGKAVPGASITANMTRHAFGWGSAVDADRIVSDATYQTKFLNMFNLAVIENHLKWETIDWAGYGPALKALDWLSSKGIPVRGHNLVWPGVDYLPDTIKDLFTDPPALRGAVAAHVTEEATEIRGRVVEWDVINEPQANHAIQDILGRSVMVDWFRLAKAADPGPRLALNEAGALDQPQLASAALKANFDNLHFLMEGGAPLGAIGLQAHYGLSVPAPADVVAMLGQYAGFGLPIAITEFDLDSTDEQFKADYTRDFLTACFSSKAVESVLFWGFWAGAHWRPDGALFREDWSLRALGQAYKDLVLGKWWTRAKGLTGPDGSWSVRGFKGDYALTVTIGRRKVSQTVHIGDSPSAVRVVLK